MTREDWEDYLVAFLVGLLRAMVYTVLGLIVGTLTAVWDMAGALL